MNTSGPGWFGRLISRSARAWQWLRSLSSTAKYLVLFVSLETLTWTPAFWGEGVQSRAGITWEDSIVAATLISAILAVSRRRIVTIVALKLAVLALASTWISEVVTTKAMYIASDVCMAIFFGFTACMILHDIWTTRGVTSDTILGSVCGYLLIGATWAFFYSLTELLEPGSFQLGATAQGISAEELVRRRDYPLLMYYSFVTLCSLGYGEMVPIKPAARMVACAEAIVGQFYMAIFVARLIALNLTQMRGKDSG